MELSSEEKQRYLRHILLHQVGEAGQVELKKAKVLVIGAGGLGCPALQYLTAAGIGKLGIIDDDVVDVSNLQRQVLYTEKDVGLPKVLAAKKRLMDMNSSVEIQAYQERLTVGNAEDIFSEYEIIVEGSDNFTTKYLANDAAVIGGKPLVFGSIFKFQGQVSVFNYQGGPTYRCLFPEQTSPGEMPSCSEVGVLGVLPGIIGSLQANEVLKIILGTGNVLSGKLLLFDSLQVQQEILSFCKNPEIRIKTLTEENFSCETTLSSLSFKEYKSMEGEMDLLDVRTEQERSIYNIGGLHIPLSELERRKEELKSEKPTLVYCASGKRSEAATALLKNSFPGRTFYSLKGGLESL